MQDQMYELEAHPLNNFETVVTSNNDIDFQQQIALCLSGDGDSIALETSLINNSPEKNSELLLKFMQNVKANDNNISLNYNFKIIFEKLLNEGKLDVNYTESDNKTDVNYTDSKSDAGNSLLHYTVEFKWDDLTELLLKNGAYIGVKNKKGELPIARMNSKLLEEFFNTQMKPTYNRYHTPDEINLDYSFLIKTKNNRDGHTNQLYPVEIISQLKHLRGLLEHPLIEYLIWTKYQGLSGLVLWNIFKIISLLITIGYMTFWKAKQIENHIWHIVFFCLIMIANIFLSIIPSIAKLCFELKYYNKRWLKILPIIVNLINHIVLFSVLLLIILNCLTDYRKTLIVVGIFLTAFDITETLKTLNIFKTMSIYILMFYKILCTFFYVLSFYLIILIAFTLSFYVIVDEESEENSVKKAAESEIHRLCRFFMKVTGMMIGDLSLQFKSDFYVYYTLMLLFMFMITMVLNNLLNGLAISDVTEIYRRAKLISFRHQVELVASTDNFLSVNILFRKYLKLCKWCCNDITLCRFVKKIKIAINSEKTEIENIPSLNTPGRGHISRLETINTDIVKKLVKYFDRSSTSSMYS